MAYQADLSPRQRAFVGLLVSGKTQEQAAQTLGVEPRTCRRYYANPAVRLALKEAQDEGLAQVCRRMSAGAGAMLDVLQAVAADVAMPPSVRVAAAKTWLDVMFRAKEMLELSQRVAALEAKMGGEK